MIKRKLLVTTFSFLALANCFEKDEKCSKMDELMLLPGVDLLLSTFNVLDPLRDPKPKIFEEWEVRDKGKKDFVI